MLFLAAMTGLEKIKAAPPAFWLKLGAVILGIVIVVVAIKKLAEVNKVVLAVVSMIILSYVGVSWIYERNEPAFMTPVINKIAPFLPSKGAYDTTQAKTPEPPPDAPKKK